MAGDVGLVELAQGGDHEAYERLAREAAPRLFLIASRILQDRDAAEDAVQQTLVAMWRDLGSLRDAERFDAWTYRMVIRYSRVEDRRRRSPRVSILDVSERLAAPGDAMRDVATREQLARGFRALSHDHRVVVVLRHLVGLPVSEIADILDIPSGTVGSRLHHAMRSMRATLEADERATMTEGQPA